MTDSKKKRLSMLDKLATPARAPEIKSDIPPARPAVGLGGNRALKAARDAVDNHHIWELDPDQIIDDRPVDRLDQNDVDDLRDAIDSNGQTVPILVRRHPSEEGRYLLVYGRRRLEAIRLSDKVHKIRAIVAAMDDHSAVQAQISENMARRDLTYVEKALFAHELIENGYGKQREVADVLTVTKSSISMALSMVERVTPELIRAIGPAPGVGRPRWDALAQALDTAGLEGTAMIPTVEEAYLAYEVAFAKREIEDPTEDPSVRAFEAVMAALPSPAPEAPKPARKPAPKGRSVLHSGVEIGRIKMAEAGFQVNVPSGDFAKWLNAEGDSLLKELHTRWKSGIEG